MGALYTVTPNAIVTDAAQAIADYKLVFGAQEKVRLTMPDGKIVHGELETISTLKEKVTPAEMQRRLNEYARVNV